MALFQQQLSNVVVLDSGVMELLVVVVKRSRVASLEHQLLAILDGLQKLRLAFAALSDFVNLLHAFKLCLLLLAKNFNLLLLKSFSHFLASGCEPSLHHCELTLVLLIIGT